MPEIIGLCNQKGGVGKTTTAINLAASLAASEKRTIIIDLDQQGNATTGLGFNKRSIESSSYSIMAEGSLPKVEGTAVPYLDLIPSGPDLAGLEVELVSVERREYRLKEALGGLSGYEFVIIDGPPSLGLMTVNILTAARYLIVPVQCEYYALEGLGDLLRTIERIRLGLNPSLEVLGILLTMYDGRNNLCREVETDLRRHFGEKVFETVIPRSVRLSEAPSHGKPVILHDIKSPGAEGYLAMAQEFLRRISKTDPIQSQQKGADPWNERRSAEA